MRQLFKWLGLLALAAFMVGCASQRTVQADSDIKTVGVLSLLRDELPVQYVGVTVFNNESRTYDKGVKFNQRAVAAAEARLKKARPSWVVKPVEGADAKALNAKMSGPFLLKITQTQSISEELKSLIVSNDLDALFVFDEQLDSNAPTSVDSRGVVMMYRRPPLGSPKAGVNAQIGVSMLDKSGAELIWRGAWGYRGISPYDLDTNLNFVSSPTVMEPIVSSAYEALDEAVDGALERSGY